MLFEPFQSVVSATFWTTLAKKKLDDYRLKSDLISLWGWYEIGNADLKQSPLLHLDERSFEEEPVEDGSMWMRGQMILLNTLDSFKQYDRKKLETGFLQSIKSKEQALEAFPGFVLVCYADLKKHIFFYHFCFPIIHQPELSFEIVQNDGPGITVFDPCSKEEAFGWPIRRLLSIHAFFGVSGLNLSIQRSDTTKHIGVKINSSFKDSYILGWEKNETGKVGPRVLDLSSLIDPEKLAEDAAELNLKLIKWRMLPELDLKVISSCRVLLVGAGTLGCNVARGLLVLSL